MKVITGLRNIQYKQLGPMGEKRLQMEVSEVAVGCLTNELIIISSHWENIPLLELNKDGTER